MYDKVQNTNYANLHEVWDNADKTKIIELPMKEIVRVMYNVHDSDYVIIGGCEVVSGGQTHNYLFDSDNVFFSNSNKNTPLYGECVDGTEEAMNISNLFGQEDIKSSYIVAKHLGARKRAHIR